MNSLKSVKEVCEIAGITRKTLFYYDRISLLEPTVRIGVQKIKMYDDCALDKLLKIRRYREAGLSVSQIRSIFAGTDEKVILQEVMDRLCAEKSHAEYQIKLVGKMIEGGSHETD